MATRTSRRPGTMRERPPGSGQWQLRAYSGTDPLTGRPRQVAKTFRGSEREAGKALAKLVAEVGGERFVSTDATVGQLLDRWADHLEQLGKARPRTLYEYRRKIEGRIKPVLGDIRLARLGPDTLDAAYGQWLADGLAPATVHKYHCILSAALAQAVKWGWLTASPAQRATPPAPGKVEMQIPTPACLGQLIKAAAADDPVLATAVALAALTGARRGELVALRWSDIDLDGGRVSIARSLVVTRGGDVHIGPTKTHAMRIVSLDELGVATLRQRWAAMGDLADLAESPLVDDPYVLSYNANGGRPANPDTITHRFAALCRAMEAPALAELRRSKPKAGRTDLAAADQWPYRFHDLRHFSVTTLIAAGVDVRTVAERHGHAQATMTLNRYAHALPERDRAAAGILGQALSPAASPVSP